MKMNTPVTKRLNFQLMNEHDWPLLFELDQDSAVMKYINRGIPTTQEQIKTIGIPRMLAYRNENKGWGLWKVTLKEDNAFIGWVLLRPMHFFTQTPDFSDIEIGWRFKQASWGYGYATEAATALCNELAKQPDIKTITAIAIAQNAGSIKVMQKLGMVFVKSYAHTDEHGNLEAVMYSKNL
ncbi:GNAT family N-acetyltransferase [Pseudoalteromonas espejiana]|uniref:GNAT family acetyltransferase n=1 Tax=Pseudoalteromonas espejiana TaxID=28107 RepID=A0A510XR02_9GAMM|nr:GNAT family N-acetyltransferase [Pseudoalteromonas espejiana]GEK53433.1 GNAT family acetyltransferase [Pseudoalteromonas espejiana]